MVEETKSSQKVFVGGLPWEVDEPKLRKWFVENAELEDNSMIDISIPRWNDSGRSRGYAIIEFSSVEAANQSLTADNKYMGSRYVEVKLSTSSNKRKTFSKPDPAAVPKSCTLLFVKNLPYETNEEQVKVAFEGFGEVTDVRLGKWNNTGRLKGFGYVHFKKPESLIAVIKSGEEISVGGRKVQYDFESNDRPKQSFKDSSGRNWHKMAKR